MQKIKSFFKGFKDGFREFSQGVAEIVNFILLTLVFIFGIGIVAILSRVAGKKYLAVKQEEKESYWKKVKIGGEKKREEYLKPF